ncbi:hypothetical protein LSCM1_07075 [Leishmania martiniquensis]|uniref:Uncharacterized protein n=1 Tax=Leishmania martiniquensis TaxID=1580590 RepID=A0A836HIY8_9TRYP|nr:hypothetical protein LSCM1_07075 [Leishmania martiniquensis]
MWGTAPPRKRAWQPFVGCVAPIVRQRRLCCNETPPTTCSSACGPASTRRRCTSSSAPLPPSLSFSVELSLPHLPGRTPLVAAAAPASTGTDAVHHATQAPGDTRAAEGERAALESSGKRAMSTEELIACLLGRLGSSPATPPRVLQERWRQFTYLCDSLVRLFMRPSARDASETSASTGSGAPRHSLVGVIVPCKEVYFSARHVSAAAARAGSPAPTSVSVGSSSSVEDMSTTQAALFLFHHHWRVPATLTLNTTVPNCAPTAVTVESGGHTQPQPRFEHDVAYAAVTPEGIDAVVADFVCVQGGSRLLLVRGDAPPNLQLRLRDGSLHSPLSREPSTMIAKAPSPRAHRTFHTAAELIRHFSAVRDRQQDEQNKGDGCARASALELCVAGYPQGHPLDRTWGAPSAADSVSAEAAAAGVAGEPDSSVSAVRQRSLAFLRAFEKDFDAAEGALLSMVRIVKSGARTASAKKRSSGARVSDGALSVASGGSRKRALDPGMPHVVMPELRELCRTLGRLGAVRRLWTCSSSYEPDVRSACVHRMLQEKVLLRPPGELQHRCIAGGHSRGGAAAAVIVTQMITTAIEFVDYVKDIKRVLRAWGSTATNGGLPESGTEVRAGGGQQPQQSPHASAPASLTPISVIPGVLLPHPTDVHVLLRSLYITKVIPSARMQQALEVYESELRSAWWQVTGGDVSAAILEVSEDRVPQVEARVCQLRHVASCRFTSAWLVETVDLLHDLRRLGQTRVHFFTMCNDKVDKRVAQLLAAYDARCGGVHIAVTHEEGKGWGDSSLFAGTPPWCLVAGAKLGTTHCCLPPSRPTPHPLTRVPQCLL